MNTLEDDMVSRVHSTMFTNPSFRQSKLSQYMWYGTAEGKKWGVVIASKDPPQYPNFIVNKISIETLIKAKSLGKVDEAHVVLAQRDGANGFTYIGVLDANRLHEQLQDVKTIFTRSGFTLWIVPPSITGSDDGDPF
jgi:hypothetical protein